MEQTFLEDEIQTLGFKLNCFDVDKLSLQLEQLNKKIKKIEEMPIPKKLEPTFLLVQRCDDHAKT